MKYQSWFNSKLQPFHGRLNSSEIKSHTPGPWRILKPLSTDALYVKDDNLQSEWLHYSRRISTEKDKLIAEVTADIELKNVSQYGYAHVDNKEEFLANASLIVAAPDLLAACEMVLQVTGSAENCDGEMTEMMIDIESAINKARGI